MKPRTRIFQLNVFGRLKEHLSGRYYNTDMQVQYGDHIWPLVLNSYCKDMDNPIILWYKNNNRQGAFFKEYMYYTCVSLFLKLSLLTKLLMSCSSELCVACVYVLNHIFTSKNTVTLITGCIYDNQLVKNYYCVQKL